MATQNVAVNNKLMLLNILQAYLQSGKNAKLRIMVVGEAGQGKSTLINGLVGSEVSIESSGDETGSCFDVGTTSVNKHILNQNGVFLEIWDTPGFGMESEEKDSEIAKSLKTILSDGDDDPLDLVLFCIRMDATRVPTHLHVRTIGRLTKIFGKQFWQHCLFVLTFANSIDQLCPLQMQLDKFFSKRCYEFEQKLRKTLREQVQLSTEEVENVRVVPVGSTRRRPSCDNPWVLPDRHDWFDAFWLEVTCSIKSSAVPSLLQANYHRLEPLSENGEPKTPFCPPPPFEPQERIVEVHKTKISETKKAVSESDDRSIEEMSEAPSISSHTPKCEQTASQTMQRDDAEIDRSVGINSDYDFIVVPDTEQDAYDRNIQWHDILLDHLQNKNSGFFAFAVSFSQLRGNSAPFLGHIGGLIEGLTEYIGGIKQRKAKEKQK